MPRFSTLLAFLPIFAQAAPNLAGLGNHENHGALCERLYAEVAAEAKPRAGYDKLARLRRRFAEFSAINEGDNRKFIERGVRANRGVATEAKIYLDIENAVLKELNDKVIQDRELVTVLTNLHKDVVWSTISEDPVLSASLLDRYSDFKSLRFSFASDNPEIRNRAKAVLDKVNKKYSEYLADLAREQGWAERVKGIGADARNWYHGGIGATPDEAGLATRYSRDKLDSRGVAVLRAYAESAPELQQAAFNAGKLQKWAAKRFESVEGFFANSKADRPVPSAEAIEAIKKTSVKAGEPQASAVARTLSARFNTKLTEEEGAALERYVNLANAFSPGLLQAKREVIDMGAPARGVISADFKGQNARNLEETMKALAETQGLPLTTRIRAVRLGEEQATASLDEKKAQFAAAMNDFLDDLKIQKVISARQRDEIKSQFTGDDGTTFVPFDLTPEIRSLAQKYLLKHMNAADARVAFVPFGEGLAADARSQWIVAAEGVEKKLRSELVGKIDRSQLNAIQIAVHLAPEQNGKVVAELHLAKNGGKVSDLEAKKILSQAKALGYKARLMDSR